MSEVYLQKTSSLVHLVLKFECQRFIGDYMYGFYSPVEIREFTIHCWFVQRICDMSNSPDSEIYWGMAIHKDGEIFDPTEDYDFMDKEWVQSDCTWVDRQFTISEIEDIVRDLWSG
eukprot:TRINITY_DN7047_c0_g1_i1.p1 TRINITY_DN7047_c0_g1~~TRINITY_DN7047_c0_g1_i1.p1  ORF type:complete len:116 (-),score=13.37 TRINITY_DN7047_c0_g1_i1:73-420(-)